MTPNTRNAAVEIYERLRQFGFTKRARERAIDALVADLDVLVRSALADGRPLCSDHDGVVDWPGGGPLRPCCVCGKDTRLREPAPEPKEKP